MSAITIAGDTSGSITLAAPDVAGTTTLTLPATSGTVMVNGSAFSAYRSTDQSFSYSTFTKLACGTEEFDTNNNFDSSTNYRFTPTVAGYYQVNGEVAMISTGSISRAIIAVYKNGSLFKYGNDISGNSNIYARPVISTLIYLNGTTDYIELYFLAVGTNTVKLDAAGGATDNYFQASMVRSA